MVHFVRSQYLKDYRYVPVYTKFYHGNHPNPNDEVRAIPY